MTQINLNYKIPNWFKWLGWIIAIAFSIALFQNCNPEPNPLISKLEKENTLLKKNVKRLDFENEFLAKVADSLDLEILNSKDRIVIIEKDKNEKIRVIDKFTVSEYQQFFAKRYPR